VFLIEKLISGFVWSLWMINNNILEVFYRDILAGIFYSVYGINDWIFCFFLLYVLIDLIKEKNKNLDKLTTEI
jgi:hypothetical protein